MRRPSLVSALASLTLVGAAACGHVRADLDQAPIAHAPAPLPVADALWAGAAKVDITPMPGLPLGGHSIEGGVGLGVWTRLWARAIYVEDARGEPLVLVAADLWSIPAGLADAVVERLHDHHGLTHVGRAQLLLAATHTHHSPANYSSSRLYNRAASTAMGFDPDLHEFLVRRIADAVASAATSKAPARVRLDHAPVAGVARNRSTAPFATNAEAPGIVAANASLPTCPDAPADAGAPGVDPCQAIDPTLTVLRVDDLDGRPLAVAGFFAVHATSMVNATDAYNGDLFAVATARAEAALARAHAQLGDPVVALFNGPEGDVSPNWVSQGRADALALGERLGDAIVATAGLDCAGGCAGGCAGACGGRVLAGEVDSRFAWVPLADQTLTTGPNAGAHTATRALPGKSILGGAEDGRTRFFARLPEGQTVERQRRAGHGPKRPAVPPALYALVFPEPTVPSEVPLSVHRIGPLIVAGLPGEFTTVMGMRIRTTLAAASAPALGPAAPRPVLVGLAGEYLSYFVTPEEYALQHYEGASTLWGQYAGSWVAEQIAALAGAAPPVTTAAPEHTPGLAHRFALAGARGRRAVRGLDQRLAAQLELGSLAALPRLELDSRPPSWTTAIWPSAQVEVRDADGRWVAYSRDGSVVDERGTELLSFPVAIEPERWRYAVVWIGPAPDPSDARYRLRVFGPDGREHCTEPFTAGEPPPTDAVACTPTPSPTPTRAGLGVVPAELGGYAAPR